MKAIFLIILSCFSIFLFPKKENVVSEVANTTPYYATSYIVMERSTYKIIEGNNYDEARSVASISKIMTAIVAIENANLEDIVIVPEEINDVYGSMLYLQVGEEIKLIDLLYGLILRSGNDAAISIAIHVGNSLENFVSLMNQKAKYLHMENSLFVNPHGLDEEDGGNISSAKDMAILHSYALNNPVYRKISQAKQYKTYQNKNRLLKQYEFCTGGKTGFTTKAKRTLVTSALKDDLELVVVTLNCGNDFNFHKALYEKYFQQYEGLIALKSGYNYLDNYLLKVDKDYVFMIRRSQENNLFLKYEIIKNTKEVKIYLSDSYGMILDEMKIVLDFKINS